MTIRTARRGLLAALLLAVATVGFVLAAATPGGGDAVAGPAPPNPAAGSAVAGAPTDPPAPRLALTEPTGSAAAGAPTDPPAPRLALTEPTGSAAVGARKLHLVDRGRRDPWAPDGRPREVGVTLRYPTRRPAATPAPYLSAAESRAFLDFQQRQAPELAQLPRELLTAVDTQATTGPPPARRPGGRPLVLLSPGFSLPAATLTGLAVDLASRGYVVAALDHPYESSGTTLADGSLAECAACDVEDYSSVPRVRARDTAFVLDRLLARGSRWRELVDPDRIAMAGHSIGGNSAAIADDRVRAVVNLDGTFFEPVRDRRRPLLMLGTDTLHRPGGEDGSWDRTWRRHRGPGAWLTVRRSGHGSFTDLPVLAGPLGVADETISGPRITRIMHGTVAAFLDRHLRGADRPAPRFPELRLRRGRV